MSSSDPSKTLLMQHFLKDLTIMLSGMAFHAADTHCATSEGAAHKGQLKERCRLEPRTNFFRLRNWEKLVWIRFGCGLDSRIYGIMSTSAWLSYCVIQEQSLVTHLYSSVKRVFIISKMTGNKENYHLSCKSWRGLYNDTSVWHYFSCYTCACFVLIMCTLKHFILLWLWLGLKAPNLYNQLFL